MSLRNNTNSRELKRLIKNALREDIGPGDVTSQIIIPKDKKVSAVLLLKEKAVVCGLDIAREVFMAVDGSIKFQAKAKDGNLEKAGKIIARIQGNARSILKAERTSLNLLSHLSGVASITRKFVDAVKPYKAKIYDTRKTIPGLRQLQKYAVKTGGGHNHRMGLYDGILIKDNHIAVSRCQGAKVSSLGELVEAAREKRPKGLKIEIEVVNLKEFKEVLRHRPDIIMLDNMRMSDIKEAVRIRGCQSAPQLRSGPARETEHQTLLEVSGGVNLDNVREIAKTGADIISIGALTHSAKAVDISLEVTDD